MSEENQKQYELISILSPQLEGENLENTKREIEKTINQFGGTINFKDEKKQNLVYPINKQGQGIFIVSQILILPENVANISKELKTNKQILRHLISQMPVVKEIKKSKPKKTTATIEKPKPKKETKTSLEEIDKKLDEIIEEI